MLPFQGEIRNVRTSQPKALPLGYLIYWLSANNSKKQTPELSKRVL
jgi:hypothetical protein